MRLSSIFPLIVLLTGANAAGIGEAWQVTPHAKSVYTDHPFRPRLDSSAFEVRTVSGVGRLAPLDESANAPKQRPEFTTLSSVEPDALPAGEQASRESRNLEHLRESLEDSSYNDDDDDETEEEDGIEDDAVPIRKLFKTELMMRLLNLNKEDEDDDDDDDDDERESPNDTRGLIQRVRRQAENETSMEKISTTKSVREARLNFPETWSTSVQPFSVEFRHRIPLDQVVQQQQEEEAALSSSYRRHQAPRADFVTSHHRRSYPESRESRDMPITRNYQDDYETPWYRNAIRERDYEFPSYRRGYSYQYPDRYRTERDYYIRPSNDPYYYDRYDRYREDDFDLYGKSRPTPKPKRIIYYATLPEIVRKPVDLRNYPRTSYDAANTAKSTGTRDSTYKRIPGNVDPSRFRYRNLYDAYDPYMKRSSYYERPYGYFDSSDTRHVKISTKENLRNDEFSAGNERKVSNLITIRDDDGKLPWPMQIGAEVSIKEDERIPGRKIFGDSASGYERFQSAQLQKAPDATGSSELQNDN